MISRKFFLKKTTLIALLLFLVVSIGTLWQVEKRVRADEWIWVPNGVRYISAAKSTNLQVFGVSGRPGATVSWVSGISTSLSKKLFGTEIKVGTTRIYVDKAGYVTNRVIFSILTATFIVVSFLLLNKLVGWKRAALISTLIGLHPLTLFKGQFVWTDLFLAIFMLLSLISYLYYWKGNKASLLVTAGIFFGLSIGTKTAGIILLPAYLIASSLAGLNKQLIKRALFSTVAVAFFGFMTFYLIYPYLWQNPFSFSDRYSELAVSIVSSQNPEGVFSIFYYPIALFKADPILTVGSALMFIPILILFIKRRSVPFSLILTAAATFSYLSVLVFVSQFGYLNGQRIASPRYIIPAIYFMVLFFVGAISYFARRGLKILWLFPIVMFLMNLYNLYYFFPYEVSDF